MTSINTSVAIFFTQNAHDYQRATRNTQQQASRKGAVAAEERRRSSIATPACGVFGVVEGTEGCT